MGEDYPGLTWEQLVKIEPYLQDLFNEAKSHNRPHGRVCANEIWFGDHQPGGGLRGELKWFAGYHAGKSDPRIRSRRAYDVAYQKIYAALPDCRGCDCEGMDPDAALPVSISRPQKGSKRTKAAIPNELRWAVWNRDNFTCRDCGARENLSIDHVFPESLGGSTTFENLATRCKSCNSRKGAKVLA